MPIYVPKQIVTLQPTTDSPLLFLAGPIRGGGDWQSEMANQILTQEPSANIACPSRWDGTHHLARHFHQPFSQADNRQLVWERHYLKQAGIEPDVPGCISLLLLVAFALMAGVLSSADSLLNTYTLTYAVLGGPLLLLLYFGGNWLRYKSDWFHRWMDSGSARGRINVTSYFALMAFIAITYALIAGAWLGAGLS